NASSLHSKQQKRKRSLMLLSNESAEDSRHMRVAVEFENIIAPFDLMTQILVARSRRMGLNYARSLLLINFLPVK
ncbi:hypothetical protein B1218_33485, partial [Pseudomonas ogarae]